MAATARALLAALASVLALAACGGDVDASLPEVPAGAEDPEQLEEGRQIYRNRCASCHGIAGEGRPAPALRDGRVAERFPDAADQWDLIADGRGGMPAFGNLLDDEEMDAIVRYTREVL